MYICVLCEKTKKKLTMMWKKKISYSLVKTQKKPLQLREKQRKIPYNYVKNKKSRTVMWKNRKIPYNKEVFCQCPNFPPGPVEGSGVVCLRSPEDYRLKNHLVGDSRPPPLAEAGRNKLVYCLVRSFTVSNYLLVSPDRAPTIHNHS